MRRKSNELLVLLLLLLRLALLDCQTVTLSIFSRRDKYFGRWAIWFLFSFSVFFNCHFLCLKIVQFSLSGQWKFFCIKIINKRFKTKAQWDDFAWIYPAFDYNYPNQRFVMTSFVWKDLLWTIWNDWGVVRRHSLSR